MPETATDTKAANLRNATAVDITDKEGAKATKAAIIGAGKEALHTIRKAREYGLFVIALDGDGQAPGLKEADLPLVIDISDEEKVLEVLKAEGPDMILTGPIGRWLTTLGAVNDALHLPGIGKKAAELCTDKLAFHEKLHREGLRSCRCFLLTGDKQRVQAATETAVKEGLSFPAILKPRFGSGSRSVLFLRNKEALEAAVAQWPRVCEEYVLEECVTGKEYGVDGAVIDGKFTMVLLRGKVLTPPPACQAVAYDSVLPDALFWKEAESYMARVVSVLGLQECLLHADIIESEEKGTFGIEVSARPSGHNLHNLFTPLCTGVDMAEQMIRHRLGLPAAFAPGATKRMMIRYFNMKGVLVRVPSREEVFALAGQSLKMWDCHLQKKERLGAVTDGHSLMGRGCFILEGDSHQELWSMTQKVMELFDLQDE